MKAIILGCGETGALWDGSGHSIGVNDCWKFGRPTNRLVVVNSFSDEPTRQQMVFSSRPADGFYTSLNRWARHPNYKEMVLRNYAGGHAVVYPYDGKGVAKCYSSTTSPLIAISLAANLGYKDIVLYGVDFVDHKFVKDQALEREVRMYLKFIAELGKLEISVYLYKNYGALADKLPLYLK